MAETLLTMLLGLHLLVVAGASAAPLLCVGLQRRTTAENEDRVHVGKWVAWLSVLGLLLGALLGLAVGVALWDESYAAVLKHLESRLVAGVWEYAFSVTLLLLYALWWHRLPRAVWARVIHGLLAVMASTNLLYHFPLLFIILSDLANSGEIDAAAIDSEAFRVLITQPYTLARAAHFVLAALTIGGVLISLAAHWRLPNGQAMPLTRWGARIALVTGLLQIPTGLLILGQMPALAQRRALGGDSLAALLLLLSVIAALVLLHQLAALAMGEVRRGLLLRTAALIAILMLLMTGASRRTGKVESGDAADRHRLLAATRYLHVAPVPLAGSGTQCH